MTRGRIAVLAASATLAALALPAPAQNEEPIRREQIALGADIYARNCAPCHGPRMLDSQVPMDLRKFPPAEKNRFMMSVTKGKNQMPPFGDLFKGDDIEALWAYVIAGERK